MCTNPEYEFLNVGSITENTAIQYTGESFGAYNFTIGPAENCQMPASAIGANVFYGPLTSGVNSGFLALPLCPDPTYVLSGNVLRPSRPLADTETYSWQICTDVDLGPCFSIFVQGFTPTIAPDWRIRNPLNALTNFTSISDSPGSASRLPRPVPCGPAGVCFAFVVCHAEDEHSDTALYFEQLVAPPRDGEPRHPLFDHLRERSNFRGGDVRLTFGVERVVPPPPELRRSKATCIQRTGLVSRDTYRALRENHPEVHDGDRLGRMVRAHELHQGLLSVHLAEGDSTIVRVRHVSTDGGTPLGEITFAVLGTGSPSR